MIPRCKHLIERNGYFTGKRCQRNATSIVTLDNAESGQPMCTQHANLEEAKRVHNRFASFAKVAL